MLTQPIPLPPTYHHSVFSCTPCNPMPANGWGSPVKWGEPATYLPPACIMTCDATAMTIATCLQPYFPCGHCYCHLFFLPKCVPAAATLLVYVTITPSDGTGSGCGCSVPDSGGDMVFLSPEQNMLVRSLHLKDSGSSPKQAPITSTTTTTAQGGQDKYALCLIL